MIDTQVKISIIIPIYNAKEYISRCLDSLLNQTLNEIEIICVLDCPTDGTDRIVEDYAKKDARIVILHNERNMHVAESRNRGLEIARGEYIGFHDHDDYNCDLHMYEDLYRQAKQDNADIVLSDAILRSTRSNQKDEYWCFADIKKEALITANILPMLRGVNPQLLSHCVWSSTYRTEFLKSNAIRFKDREKYLDEDRLFNFEAYLNADKISYIPQAYYIWEQVPASISHNFPTYMVSAQITRTQFYVDYLKEYDAFDQYQKTLWTLLSLEMKVYKDYYANLSREEWHRLGDLMRGLNFPIWGYNYGLRILGKKRWLLVWFNIKAKFLS